MTAWYINRSAGIVAWALLSASMIVGLLLSSKVLVGTAAGQKARPNWLNDLHRWLSALSVVFVGVHVLGAIGDNYIHFDAVDVLVPFASSWRPVAMAWAVVSLYLLVAVQASSLLRPHIPKTVWRRMHYLTFPLFLTATAHALTAGTDVAGPGGIAVATFVTLAIGALTARRIRDEVEKAAHPPAPRVRPATLPPAGPPQAPVFDPRPPASTPLPSGAGYAPATVVAPYGPPTSEGPTRAYERPLVFGDAEAPAPGPSTGPTRVGTPF